MDVTSQNKLAIQLGKLHIPGKPLIMANAYDAATAAIVIANPAAKAVATASYAIAAVDGVQDDDLTWEQNLTAIRKISSVVSRSPLPLSVDIQDAYEDVRQTIQTVIREGAVGCNLEDTDSKTGHLRTCEDAVKRIKQALTAAKDVGVPDFVVNARSDVLGFEGTIEDAIARGKCFLAAGATTVFIWGGAKGRGLTAEEVKRLTSALGGRLNVMMRIGPDFLTVPELRAIGVARISVGPGVYFAAMKAFADTVSMLVEA